MSDDTELREQLEDVIGEVQVAIGEENFRTVLERVQAIARDEREKAARAAVEAELQCWGALAEMLGLHGDFVAEGVTRPGEEGAFREHSAALAHEALDKIELFKSRYGPDWRAHYDRWCHGRDNDRL